MLLDQVEEPFDDPNYIYELKFDGSRVIAYIDQEQTILKNKRQKILNPTFPELNELHKFCTKRCILDGELVCMKQGKPDFYTLQARSLLMDPIRIAYQAKKNPATFVVYDILFAGDEEISHYPLLKRKEIISEVVHESPSLAISRYIEEHGKAFFQLAAKEGLEGIVAKKKDSIYLVGTRSKSWIKIKVMQEDDLLICGYVLDENQHIKSLILGKEIDGEYAFVATIASRIAAYEQKAIFAFAKKYPSSPLFLMKTEKEVQWIQPELIAVVEYMMKTKSGGLRQAIFKGIKRD